MPIYVWRDDNTNKEVSVLRDSDSLHIEPSRLEATQGENLREEEPLTDNEYENAKWTRLIGTGITATRGTGWRGKKGSW